MAYPELEYPTHPSYLKGLPKYQAIAGIINPIIFNA